jgi:hypothetical protein
MSTHAANTVFVVAKPGEVPALRRQIGRDAAAKIVSGKEGGFVVRTPQSPNRVAGRYEAARGARSSSPTGAPAGGAPPNPETVEGSLVRGQGAVGIVVVPRSSPASYRLVLDGNVVATRPERIQTYRNAPGTALVAGTIEPSEPDHRILLIAQPDESVTKSDSRRLIREKKGEVLTELKRDVSTVQGATDSDFLHDGAPSRPSLKPPQWQVRPNGPFGSVLRSDETAIRNTPVSPGLMLLANRKTTARLPVKMTIGRANRKAALDAVRAIGSVRVEGSVEGPVARLTVQANDTEALADIDKAKFALDADRLSEKQFSPDAQTDVVQKAKELNQAATNATAPGGGSDTLQPARIVSGVPDWIIGVGAVGLGLGTIMWSES